MNNLALIGLKQREIERGRRTRYASPGDEKESMILGFKHPDTLTNMISALNIHTSAKEDKNEAEVLRLQVVDTNLRSI